MDENKQAALFDFTDLGKDIQKSLTDQDMQEGQSTDLESSPLTPQVITRKPGVPPQPTPAAPIPTPEEEYKKTLERQRPGQPPVVKKPKVKQKPIEERAPEVGVLHEFFPSILNQDVFYDEKNDQHIDSSLTVFEYLKAMGYKRGQWILGPEWRADNCHKHKQKLLVNYSNGRRYENVSVPICLARSSSTFAIDSILANAADHAAAHGYSPAKPIIALSHPGCYSSDTRVLTNNGFKYFKDVLDTDTICSLNPITREIEYVKFTKRIEYKYTGKLINFKSRGFDALVTPDHNMAFSTMWKKDEIRLEEAQHIINNNRFKNFKIPRTGSWVGRKPTNQEKLLIKFFGWYISEGSVIKRKNGNYQISISQSKEENRIKIENILKELGLPFGRGKQAFTIHGSFAKYIYDLHLGKSYEKRVPSFIKELDKDSIEEFLNEFCLGDGHKRIRNCFGFKSSEVCYYTSSKQLVSDLVELILKTGKSAKIELDKKKGTISNFKNGSYISNFDTYCIRESKSKNSIFTTTNRSTGLNKSSITEINYNDYVYCLELEKNHILCFERNGNIGWCGNCRCSIYFQKPANYSSIPDNAPGLPMYADKKSLTKFKKELYERLPDVSVNRWSFIAQKDIDAAIPVESKKNFRIKDSNPEPEGSEYASMIDVIIKTADEVWEEDIRPIKVTQNFMFYQFPGILTPIPKSYIGFQLAKTDKIARIYLTELGHEITVPIKMLNYLQLVPSNETADANTFIEVDGEYGIILQVRDYEDPVCYIPAFEEIMTLEGDYKKLKAIG